jgi:hypothetical protein
MSKLTGLLVMDLFGNVPRAHIGERQYFDLNDLNYRRLQALAVANPGLEVLLDACLVIRRPAETICLVPVDVVTALQQTLKPPEGADEH